jgi:hypothetical protein
MNGGTKIGVRLQTASKAEVRSAGFRPAPQIEGGEGEEEEEKEVEEKGGGEEFGEE